MRIDVMMKILDNHDQLIDHDHIDRQTREHVAKATHNYGEHVSLYYNNDKYEIPRKAKKVPQIPVPGNYPDKKYKDTCFGREILKNGEPYANVSFQPILVGKKGILPIRITVNTYQFEEGNLFVFKAGPKDTFFHYYCVYDNFNRCIGIIERGGIGTSGSRSRIYLEDESYLTQMLLINMQETMMYYIDSDGMRDPSACNYISIRKAELERLDNDLLARWKSLYDERP